MSWWGGGLISPTPGTECLVWAMYLDTCKTEGETCYYKTWLHTFFLHWLMILGKNKTLVYNKKFSYRKKMEEFFRQIKGHNSKTEKIELGLPFMFSDLVYKFQTICEELKSVSGNQMHTDMGKSQCPQLLA